jgi:3-hydroxyacyl-CoA dehydrogenase
MLQKYQRWTQGMRYAPKPVVTAPFGRVLGGGAEVAMHSTRTVAAVETAMGLVEVSVGLIPAAGGCTELNRRLVAGAAALPGGNPQAALRQVFEMIAQAQVSGSAVEAHERGLLRPTDRIVMNGEHLLGVAREVVQELAKDYLPPAPGKHCYALGQEGLTALQVAIQDLQEAGQASEYDAFIAGRLAHVLCGGELSVPQWVDEQYILDLERQVFLELCREPKTHARIQGMLETGKPVRN